MIDNFDLIKTLLTFETADDFYYCQIIRRKKENPDVGKESYTIKSYSINSIKELDSLQNEMITIAKAFNARVYIALNKRSYEDIAYQNLKKISEYMSRKDFKSVKKAYNSCCGGNHNESTKSKRWIIDVDENNTNIDKEIQDYINEISFEQKNKFGNHILASIPTKNGHHLITKKFDSKKFTEKFPKIDLHKDAFTLLWCL